MDYFHHTDPHHKTLAYSKDGFVHTYTQLLSQNRIECKLAVYTVYMKTTCTCIWPLTWIITSSI